MIVDDCVVTAIGEYNDDDDDVDDDVEATDDNNDIEFGDSNRASCYGN